MSNLLYIASILFMQVVFMHIRMWKLHDSGNPPLYNHHFVFIICWASKTWFLRLLISWWIQCIPKVILVLSVDCPAHFKFSPEHIIVLGSTFWHWLSQCLWWRLLWILTWIHLLLKFYAFVDSYLFTGISNSAMYFKQKLMNVLSFSSPINLLIS